MSTTKQKLSISDKWNKVIIDRGLKQKWIADKADISESHLSNVLAERVFLTDDVRDAINKVLGTDFK